MKKTAAAITASALLSATLLLPSVVYAGDDEGGVVARLERLCGNTENAADLTPGELKAAIAELEALDAEVRKSDYAKRKLYLFRIGKCRDFIRFALDVKK
ncbi:MAG: hypothetical protein HZA20_01830 [Nitrospirae bacterium]|nr:hypothetical protein [Nitrospirota bacterium]